MSLIPAMDKPNYILPYTIEQRCVGGKMPMRGAVIDESSGSTGEPNNWVRGPEERKHVARMLQISMHHMLGGKPRMFINAFALGPWATRACACRWLLSTSACSGRPVLKSARSSRR